MSYSAYRYVFWGALVIAVLLLALTVYIFFYLDIGNVIGELSGSNKKKMIESRSKRKDHRMTAKIKSIAPSPAEPVRRQVSDDDAVTGMLKKGPPPPPKRESKPVPPIVFKTVSPGYAGFSVINEITFVHSNELIS